MFDPEAVQQPFLLRASFDADYFEKSGYCCCCWRWAYVLAILEVVSFRSKRGFRQ